MAADPELDPEALGRLRELARALHGEDWRAVPLDRLVRLADDVRLEAGVTIDLEGSRELGQPFVILRVGSGRARSRGRCRVDPLASLSVREREVAGLVAEGLSNKLIARRLGISLATVKDHVHRILAKTGLPNRTAVAAASLEPGPR